ncbi:MAG: hypothetical protein AB8B85_05155 [Paracoccaceae bacterium]
MTISAFDPIKPDRYQDWQRQWSADNGDHWVNIIVNIPNDDEFDARIERLVALLDPETTPDSGEPEGLRASADERALLGTINVKTPNPKLLPAYQRIFFFYLRESEVFDAANGRFIDRDLYETLYAGPPLFGLNLEDIGRGKASLTSSQRPSLIEEPVIGIIDYGIGFAHERFRLKNAYGRSRVRALWVQRREVSDDSGNVALGQRYDSAELDGLVPGKEDRDIYRDLGLLNFGPDLPNKIAEPDPGQERLNPLSQRVTHGTHVLDLAAGEQPEESDAPSILAVELPPEAAEDTSGVTMASYVLQGLRQLMLWADTIDQSPGETSDRPMIVNFSFGITAGPKDGSSTFEQIVDLMIGSRLNTHCMLPAGNHRRQRLTAGVEVIPDQAHTVDWLIRPDDRTSSFVEIWSQPIDSADLPYAVHVTAPGGESLTALSDSGKACELRPAGATAPWAAVYTDCDPDTHRWRVFVAVGPTSDYDDYAAVAPMGAWKITFESKRRHPIAASVFVQRDETPVDFYRDGRQSTLDHAAAYDWDESFLAYTRLGDGPLTEKTSFTAIGSGRCTDVIGAAVDEARETAAPYTASGPVGGRVGPNYSAIAERGWAHRGVLAAGTLSGTTSILAGTSVAAPQAVRAQARGEAARTEGDYKDDTEIAGGRARLPPNDPDERRHLIGHGVLPAPAERDLKRRYSPG